MKNLDPKEEAKLIKATETAIRLSNQGMSPNAAVEKVARENEYSPQYIKLMATAFNKSKAVHVFKTAAQSKRADSFDLADSAVIIKAIYTSSEDHQKVAFELPAGNFSQVDIPKLQKVADTRIPARKEAMQDRFYKDMSEASKCNIINKYAALQKATKDRLESDIRIAYLGMNEALDEAAEHLKPMSDKAFNKIAQLVVNSYPKYGQQMVKLLAASSRHDIPELQKTAHAAIFPPREPFLSIAKMVDKAFETTRSKNALTEFDKIATDSLIEDFVANLGASSVHDLGLSSSRGLEDVLKKKETPAELAEELDPSFFNKLKEVDTRKNFMNLALYDDDLNKYEFPALIKAYNDSVQMTGNEGANNRVVLRNMMLHNLETGGIKDPFSMKTELDVGKALSDKATVPLTNEKLRADVLKSKSDMKSKAETEYYDPAKKAGKETWTSKLQKHIQEGTKTAVGMAKDTKSKGADQVSEEEKIWAAAIGDIKKTWKDMGATLKNVSVAELNRMADIEARKGGLGAEPTQEELDWLADKKSPPTGNTSDPGGIGVK